MNAINSTSVCVPEQVMAQRLQKVGQQIFAVCIGEVDWISIQLDNLGEPQPFDATISRYVVVGVQVWLMGKCSAAST